MRNRSVEAKKLQARATITSYQWTNPSMRGIRLHGKNRISEQNGENLACIGDTGVRE